MATVFAVERIGSTSGKPKDGARAVIVDSGLLPKHWRPKRGAVPEPPGQPAAPEDQDGGVEVEDG